MIVRNEVRVIERCLASVRDCISHWVVVDTGSTDGTQDRVREALRGIPGTLHERPWVDFAHNRNEALEYARGKADWVLVIDADEVLVSADGFTWPALTHDAYRVEMRHLDVSYERTLLVKNTGEWRYRGVLHETMIPPPGRTVGRLRGLTNVPRQDGARSTDPNKYKRDALVLEAALLDEPDNDRYVFYLAQSHRDAGAYARALEHYRRRVRMGGDPEEVWYALYQSALMQSALGEPWEQVLAALLEAYARGPHRAEPLYRIAAHYSQRRERALADLFAREAAQIPAPETGLFVERDVYEYRIPFESALCQARAGQHGEAIRLFNRIMSIPGVAPDIYVQSLEQRRVSVAAYPRAAAGAGDLREPRVVVCVPFEQPGHFLDNCVDSLLAQRGVDLRIVFFDNASADGSRAAIPVGDPRVTVMSSPRPLTTTAIIQAVVTEQCGPDDVFALLDGRDWLAHDHALATVARLYAATDCRVLYGQYREANGRMGRAEPYADAIAFVQLERARFPHGIMTFQAGLYQELARESEALAWDDECSRIEPVLRRAGFARVRFHDEALVVSNTDAARRRPSDYRA
jgi:glycosyltransferase involved in cell wall biosynthesis